MSETDEFVLEVDNFGDDEPQSAVDAKVEVEEKHAVAAQKPKVNGKTSVDEPEFNFLETEKKKDPEPCKNFRLDPGAAFGTCRCGHPKSAHGAKGANKAAELLTNLKKKNRESTLDDDDDMVESGDGPCNKFRLDVSAATFGTCKCGYKRNEHGEKAENKAKMALDRLKSSNLDKYQKEMTADGPCNNYKVDVSAAEFGTCHCGYKKEDHVEKEENIASKLLKNLKDKNKERNDKDDQYAVGLLEQEVPEETTGKEVAELNKAEQEAEESKNDKKKKKKNGKGGPCVIC